MSRVLSGAIQATARLFEVEGIIDHFETDTNERTGYVQDVVVFTNGLEIYIPLSTLKGGKFDFDRPLDEGMQVGIRSFTVPALDRETGVVTNSKRYVFGDTLAECTTREQYIASDYYGKPPVVSAAPVIGEDDIPF